LLNLEHSPLAIEEVGIWNRLFEEFKKRNFNHMRNLSDKERSQIESKILSILSSHKIKQPPMPFRMG
jgi:hypothetical protein